MRNSENKLAALKECFLSFGPDPLENINRLVALCGRLQEATCAIYNRLEKKTLHSVGMWNVSQDYPVVQDADGTLCNDLIQSCSEEVVVIRDLPGLLMQKPRPLLISIN